MVEKVSKGDLNRLIDKLIHPLIKRDPRFILVDSLLHAMVERDPPLTVRKFIKYNLPKIIEALMKEKGLK